MNIPLNSSTSKTRVLVPSYERYSHISEVKFLDERFVSGSYCFHGEVSQGTKGYGDNSKDCKFKDVFDPEEIDGKIKSPWYNIRKWFKLK